MDDLLREFVGETLEMMEAVAGDLVAWERDPADQSGLDRIFRTVHTVKGSSSFFDLPRITAVAHAAEELLDVLRARRTAPRAATVAVVLSAFDRIRDLTQAIVAPGSDAKEPAGDDSELIGALLKDLRQSDAAPIADAVGVPVEPAAQSAPASFVGGSEIEPAQSTPHEWRSVRIPVSLLDELMSGVSDLVLARNEVTALLRQSGFDTGSLPAFERLSSLLSSVRNAVGQMRMVPLRHLFAPLPRIIRQVASELGKDVRLEIHGGEVEIDREVSESLRDPMVHALRNAIDHGIEDAATRIAAGKPAHGTLTIGARQSGNRIIISIDDDGMGLALDRLVARAVSGGRLDEAEAAALSDQRRAELIFLPGLSTAQAVTGISGRGVGMDVVKANVERLGGYVHVRNRTATGLGIDFDVPMTLTIITALAISAGGQDFAIPRSIVEEVMLASSDAVHLQSAGGAGVVRVRDRLMPLLRIEEMLGLPSVEHEAEDRALVLCRISSRQLIALDVPDVRDHEELVIKPLPPLLLSLGLYSGMSLPDSGRPMLVLDIDSIARNRIIADVGMDIANESTGRVRADISDSWLIFSPLGATSRLALSMPSIGRIVDLQPDCIGDAGGMTIGRIDDDIWPLLCTAGAIVADAPCRVIQVGDGQRSLLLAVDDIGAMAALTISLPSKSSAIPLLGIANHDGRMVEMIDVARLLEASGALVQEKMS